MIQRLAALVFLILLISFNSFAEPPKPKEGFRWVLNLDYSDNFDGTALDKSKWTDVFKFWKGRPPAKFVPSTISLSEGNMQIRNGVLSPADGNFTIAGGAVQSVKDQASYGYYECRLKSSSIMMSTTFWMSNLKERLNSTTCTTDSYSQELDITEVIGKRTDKFATNMNSNTHYRHVPCGESNEIFHSASIASEDVSKTLLFSKVDEDFHTYACYWIDAHSVEFYADNRFVSKVDFNTDIDQTDPFDRPMRVNMVTETYDWAKPYPTNAELNDNSINTSYYDWVRSYKLIPIDEAVPAAQKPGADLEVYTEKMSFDTFIKVLGQSDLYTFPITYQANYDRDLYIELRDASDEIVASATYLLLAGFGNGSFDLVVNDIPELGSYKINAELRTVGGGSNDAISNRTLQVDIKDLITGTTDLLSDLTVYPNPARNEISVKGAELNARYQIIDILGSQQHEGVLENNRINIESLSRGVYILKLSGAKAMRFVKD